MSDIRKLLVLISALIVLLFIVWLSDSGYVLNSGFGEYTTTTTSKSVVTDPITSQKTITETSTTEVHTSKTLWDWMQLLIIPIALGLGAWWLNKQERENERKLTEDRQQEATLQTYLDKMYELLLKEDLLRRQADIGQPVRNVAQARTTTALRVLNVQRRHIVTGFLYDAYLVNGLFINASLNNTDLSHVVFYGFNMRKANLDMTNLSLADLREAKLVRAKLNGADLRMAKLVGADLRMAKFIKAKLNGADLRLAKLGGAMLNGADLRKVDLRGAELSGADLSESDLRGALVTDEQLAQVRSLKCAIMSKGKIHD
jgi:uncharacterized protein YjbI with pentapeptide repeats